MATCKASGHEVRQNYGQRAKTELWSTNKILSVTAQVILIK